MHTGDIAKVSSRHEFWTFSSGLASPALKSLPQPFEGVGVKRVIDVNRWAGLIDRINLLEDTQTYVAANMSSGPDFRLSKG